jgi:EAL domain-containing protein (putative c-di-GMP-specific phosphodiesterase class I)/GGDEF domain-containing protein
MSLIRQIWVLLIVTLLVAFVGSFAVWMVSSRGYLETQLQLKNADNAQALALSLSQQKGDMALMDVVVAAQFDTGFYQRIRLLEPSGKVLFDHAADPHVQVTKAPAWFARLVPIESVPGTAEVTDGWRALGAVEVVSHVGFAHDQLWKGSVSTASLLLLLALVSGAVASQGVVRIRRPLQATVEQARALMERRFITVKEPGTPELASVTTAMNTMVNRLKVSFEDQALQVEQLRQQAHCDALTGVSQRAHFLAHLQSALVAEDGPSTGALYLIRLVDLGGINRHLGHRQTDDLLKALAVALRELTQGVTRVALGRLNGGDFAVCLHDGGAPPPQAEDVADMLKRLFAEHATVGQAVVGATRWSRGHAPSQVLAAADIALARAESRGHFAAVVSDSISGRGPVVGEDEWRRRLALALQQGRLRLVQFPVISAAGKLIHQECPMRLQWEDGGDFESAAQWLPMAKRCGFLPQIDEQAVRLALTEIQRDSVPRGVNVSAASLQDAGFAHRLGDILQNHVAAAKLLWLEVSEDAALAQFESVQALCQHCRPMGVKVGLEHAGEQLTRIEALFESGLDYVKLDGTIVQGLAGDVARRAFVSASVRMLHNLGLQVFAEGVNDDSDLTALWQCGVDGATGPAVRLPLSN